MAGVNVYTKVGLFGYIFIIFRVLAFDSFWHKILFLSQNITLSHVIS